MGATLNRLAHSLGLTKSWSEDISDIITDKAVFLGSNIDTCMLPLYPPTISTEASKTPNIVTTYYSHFSINNEKLELCSKSLYDDLCKKGISPNEEVLLSYRNISSWVCDYQPPDFNQKRLIAIESIRPEYVAVSRLE